MYEDRRYKFTNSEEMMEGIDHLEKYEHMIKARAHKGGVRIGKTPKKLASICCP
jgi:hypothetical protein